MIKAKLRSSSDLIRSVNHIAIIVSDVGRSLAFYTEIIGFQQIQRPNFDREMFPYARPYYGRTYGNISLPRIKGKDQSKAPI